MSVENKEEEPVSIQTIPEDGGGGDEEEAAAEAEYERRVLISDPRVPYDIVMMEDVYGEGQRGVIANRPIAAHDAIQIETSLAYVSYPFAADNVAAHVKDFFGHVSTVNGERKTLAVMPEELKSVPGGVYVALTGEMIARHEKLAVMIVDPLTGFHGRINPDPHKSCTAEEAHALIEKHYLGGGEEEAEKTAFWTLQMTARLFAVVQSNSKEGFVPMSINLYGIGMFPGSAYFNHSCSPNAVLTMLPGKVFVQAILDIEPGAEITIAYQEIPIDMLSEDLTRTLQLNAGLRGECKCKTCKDTDEEELKAVLGLEGGDGSDPANKTITPEQKEKPQQLERVIRAGFEYMWCEETFARISKDGRLRALVLSMIKAPAHEEGAAAACSLRQLYAHYLAPDMTEDYCPDLAYVLGDLYCRNTIHVKRQWAEDYHWWPRVFAMASQKSDIKLPHAMYLASVARAYGAILAAGTRETAKEAEDDIHQFMIQWVGARLLQKDIHGHTANLVLACRTYEVLADMCTSVAHKIEVIENQCVVDMETRRTMEQMNHAMDPSPPEVAVATATILTPKEKKKAKKASQRKAYKKRKAAAAKVQQQQEK